MEDKLQQIKTIQLLALIELPQSFVCDSQRRMDKTLINQSQSHQQKSSQRVKSIRQSKSTQSRDKSIHINEAYCH